MNQRAFLMALLIAAPFLTLHSADTDGFQPIFDGKTLQGWSAPNLSYWSVEDGAITAKSTEENPCHANQFLVWQGGEVADFELKLQFRLENNKGNSGVQFRSKIDERGRGVGYQADILPQGPWCGAWRTNSACCLGVQ